MKTDILIQNVSAQCIPNLVAVKTFHPRKLIWVYTPEFGDALNRLRASTAGLVAEQENWRVDARDAEGMHAAMQHYFQNLDAKGRIIYHLTGGTKSMSLQGLYNLGSFRRNRGADVCGVVMNPRTQHFDVLYPQPANGTAPCSVLNMEEMLHVHGNSWDQRHAHEDVKDCWQSRELWEQMRTWSPALRQTWNMNDMRALHKKNCPGNHRHFSCAHPIPRPLKQMFGLLQEYGLIGGLSYPAKHEVRYEQHAGDMIKLIVGGWLECWLGAVLYDSGIQWHGARVSAHVLEKGGGSQEFDFIGAHGNHLVYWSCKTDKKLTNDKIFEVDALRDGIAGSDFHIAGLLHTATVKPIMRAKARRMNLHMVGAYAESAAEQIVRASGG